MVAIASKDLVALTMAAARTEVGSAPLGAVIRADRAQLYAAALDGARTVAALTTPMRVRHFVAQVAHETGGFGALVENTLYTNPAHLLSTFRNEVKTLATAESLVQKGAIAIANLVYANRLGNGDEMSGDGYRYRGRGFLMVTGKGNYADVQASSGLPLLAEPDRLGEPVSAATAAARFWAKRDINSPADRDDTDGVTRLVNGPGMNGADKRRAWLRLAEAVWPG